MSKFTESAKTHLKRSRVIDGREKLDVDEVIKRYPDGVTIDEFDVLDGKDGKEYVVLHIKDTNNYFNGGSLALKVCKGWVEDFGDGNPIVASDELKNDGGAMFKIYHTMTKNGNRLTAFDPID